MTNLFDPDEEYANLLNRHLVERNNLVNDNSEHLNQIFLRHRTKLGNLRTTRGSVVTFVRQRAQEEFLEIDRQQKLLNSLIIRQIEEIAEFMNILNASYPGYSVYEVDEDAGMINLFEGNTV